MKYMSILLAGLFLLTAATQAKYEPNHFDPDNAAHWYRKAFDLYTEPNDIDFDGFVRGESKLTPQIEQYLKSQEPVIDLIKKASQIEHCDWEYNHYLYEYKNFNIDSEVYDYIRQIKKMCLLIYYQIEVDLYNGHIDKAIGHTKLIFKIARDIDSTATLPSIFSCGQRNTGYLFINKILDALPAQSAHLTEIKIILFREANYRYSTFDDKLSYLIKWAEQYCNKSHFQIEDEAKEWFSLLRIISDLCKECDDDFYERNARFYINRLSQAKQLCQLPYPQQIEKMDKLGNDLSQRLERYILKRFPNNIPDDFELTKEDYEYLEKCDYVVAALLFPLSVEIQREVITQNRLNTLRCAVMLRQTYDKTNKLSDRIPLSYPKDVFSNKPFILHKTETGFEIAVPRENLLHNEKAKYKFKLPDEK